MPDTINITIRPAQASDEPTIKALIRRERLDLTSLNWRNFLIGEHDERIVGIGQVKRYWGCHELGSLVTVPEYRGKGVAAQLITALEAQVGLPLYLLCVSRLEAFYQQFDYQMISWRDAPMVLRLKLAGASTFRLFGVRVIAMRKLGN